VPPPRPPPIPRASRASPRRRPHVEGVRTPAPHEIAERYRRFADLECKGYSEAYYRLALAVAEDAQVLSFLAPLPVWQPNLFFATLQFLAGTHDMPADGHDLRALLVRRGPDVADLMRVRRTQTNEVARCAALLPALPAGPLALVEVGASAGLCLLLDRFFYDWGAAQLGPPTSPVRLRCPVAGPAPLPAAMPAIVWRRGLDLAPVDVHDATATRWLLACVWPDQPERRRRLERAIEVARAHTPEMRKGDLVDDLPALLSEAPVDAQLVVFHSAVLAYVAPERRQAFADMLTAESRVRDIVWISNEGPGIVPGIPDLGARKGGMRFVLGRTRLSRGRRADHALALAHPHGADLRWLASA